MPVLFLHKWKAGEKQTGRALPLSGQNTPFSWTPKAPHPVKQRQNFVECRRLDFFKEAMPGFAGLAAAATAIFSHGFACISLELASKIYPRCLLSNRLALFPCFAEIRCIGHFSPQFSTVIRTWGTHYTKTAPTSYFAPVFRRIFRQRRIVSQGNVNGIPTRSTERSHFRGFQAGTFHQMYGLAHGKTRFYHSHFRAIRSEFFPSPVIVRLVNRRQTRSYLGPALDRQFEIPIAQNLPSYSCQE